MHGIEDQNPSQSAGTVIDKGDLSAFLLGNGIKPTRQRVAIATHIFDKHQHIAADTILARVNKDPETTNVSKATVYNTLKLFVSEGILNEVAINPERILFDTNTDRHDHILNTDTGEIRDIKPVDIDLTQITGLVGDESVKETDLIVKVSNNKKN